MIIKVCGMACAENIRDVEALGIDMMGFIFYPHSSRFVAKCPDYLPQNCSRIGVFVNEKEETIIEKAQEFSLDYIQLHGTESSRFCNSLSRKGFKIIKVFSINNKTDLAKETQDYGESCSYFLFDTHCAGFGGAGTHFDWSLLQDYVGSTPFLLSGGISIEDVEAIQAIKHKQFAGIDINSRFETAPAHKDVSLIKQFISKIKNR